jgi:type IV secretion system protein TrbE
MKEPPSQTAANLLHRLLEIPCSCIVVSEWQRQDNFAMRKLIQSKRRHHHNSKSSLMNYVNFSEQPTTPDQMLIDDSASAMVHDLGACLEEMEVNGNYFGKFSFTVILYDRRRDHVERAAAETFKVFSTLDSVMIEERYNLLNAFLGALPGNGRYNLRYLYLLNTNYADLSFLFTSHCGEVWNRHLGDEYLAILETTQRNPYFLNLHYQDVAHTVILGRTGSGKSFFLNFLLTNLQKYKPSTFIFDLGGSYEHLTRLFGGSYLKVRNWSPLVSTNSIGWGFGVASLDSLVSSRANRTGAFSSRAGPCRTRGSIDHSAPALRFSGATPRAVSPACCSFLHYAAQRPTSPEGFM